MPPVDAVACFLLGALSWALAIRRTTACVRGERFVMCSLCALETLVAAAPVFMAATSGNYWLVVCEAAGAAVGAAAASRPSGRG
jgi:hypothetical protein